MIEPTAEEDPVIVFDALTEQANRLRAKVIAVEAANGTDPVEKLHGISDRIRAISVDDVAAMWALYHEFQNEATNLRA